MKIERKEEQKDRWGGLEKITAPLLQWFEQNKRALPWREDVSPYRVWVSEIMLQQTRVEAVRSYFQHFMEELPTISDLARCPQERLLKLWEGLGYYNRVRNMQIAAQTIEEQYEGKMPASYEEILKLKGIGSYTAGAIASIAFGIAEPAVDGNVLRVITRVMADDMDIMKQSNRKLIEDALRKIMPQEEPGSFNQALMELGATVCLPNGAPLCEKCPWQEICKARKQERIDQLPVKTKAKARRIEKRTVLVIREGEKVVIQKRPAKGLLAGLYEFPNLEGEADQEEVLRYLKEQGLSPIRIQPLESSKHIFSHVEWQMMAYVIKVEEQERWCPADPNWLLVEGKTAEEQYAIPSAFAAYTRYMQIRIGKEKKILKKT